MAGEHDGPGLDSDEHRAACKLIERYGGVVVSRNEWDRLVKERAILRTPAGVESPQIAGPGSTDAAESMADRSGPESIAPSANRRGGESAGVESGELVGWLCLWRWRTEHGAAQWNFDAFCHSEDEAIHLPRNKRNKEHHIVPILRPTKTTPEGS